MLLRQPRYFKDFRCIGGACTDNCCVGWEIPIDDETNARYQFQPGAFGERLRAGISAPKDGHFLLREGRCPFLNRQGLCEIILEMGGGGPLLNLRRPSPVLQPPARPGGSGAGPLLRGGRPAYFLRPPSGGMGLLSRRGGGTPRRSAG